MPDDGWITEARIEVVEYLVCKLAEYGEEQVVRSCIYVLGEMSYREIATVIGTSTQYVHATTERALRKAHKRAALCPELWEAADG